MTSPTFPVSRKVNAYFYTDPTLTSVGKECVLRVMAAFLLSQSMLDSCAISYLCPAQIGSGFLNVLILYSRHSQVLSYSNTENELISVVCWVQI